MDEQLLAKIAEGVHRREYSLLLGAGASIGSLGGDNKTLPSGPELRDLLVDAFSIPTEGREIELQRAYAAAKRSDSDQLEQFIRNRFTNCKPTWQHLLTEFDWHRIWTLNIDDTVEVAYRSQNVQIDRFNWTSTFRDTATSKNQIIHLHGFAKDALDSDTSESDVVFSMAQYISTLQDPRSWHTVFTDEFAERPIIVLGASLADEFDLHQALSNSGSESTRGFPSVIVLNRLSTLDTDELLSYGLIPIESDARIFMERLQQQIVAHRSAIENYYHQGVNDKLSRFLQQFIDLRRYRPQQSERTRHFYEGFDPHWRNIIDDDDAIFEATRKALATIRDAAMQGETKQAVYVLTGGRGSGKSTGLLRVADGLIAAGFFAFHFRGDEDLDIEATIEWLRNNPKTALVFNDCADFAASLRDLAERCGSLSLNLLIVGCERSSRHKFLEQKIGRAHLNPGVDHEYSLLSDQDIVSLVDKLGSRRRLGSITRRTQSQRYTYFRATASRLLFEGMANLEGGVGFRQRIRAEYSGLEEPHLKRLYAAASIAYQFGYSVPLGVASKVSGLSVRQVIALLEQTGHDQLLLDENGVRLPHRFTAALVVSSALSTEDKFGAVYRLAFALAPHVDIRAIRGLSRAYRLVRRLMHQDTIRDMWVRSLVGNSMN